MSARLPLRRSWKALSLIVMAAAVAAWWNSTRPRTSIIASGESPDPFLPSAPTSGLVAYPTGRETSHPEGETRAESTASRYIVCDVASELPVAGLAFRYPSEAGVTLVTRSDGTFDAPTGAGLPGIGDSKWALVSDVPDSDQRWRCPVVWVARRVVVRGRIIPAPGEVGSVDFRRLHVSMEFMGPVDSTLEAYARSGMLPPAGPSSRDWLAKHHLSRQSSKTYDRSTGEFEFDGFSLRRLGLRVIGPGWSCATQSISELLPPGASEIYVEVPVRRRRQASGIVVDERGAPVVGARARIQLHRSLPIDQVKPDRFEEMGCGFGVAGQPDGTAAVSIAGGGATDSIGEFLVEGPSEIDWDATLLVVGDPATRPVRLDLGAASLASRVRVELTHSDRTITLSDHGVTLCDAIVDVTDLTDRRNQLPLGALRSDALGKMPAAWLEPGRDYLLFVTRNEIGAVGAPYFVRWRGLDIVELSTLESNLTRFEREPLK